MRQGYLKWNAVFHVILKLLDKGCPDLVRDSWMTRLDDACVRVYSGEHAFECRLVRLDLDSKSKCFEKTP